MICGSGKYFRVLSVGMAAGLLASCSSRPGEVLSDDVMAALLADLYVGEAYTVLEGPMAASASIGDIDSAQRVLRQGTMRSLTRHSDGTVIILTVMTMSVRK